MVLTGTDAQIVRPYKGYSSLLPLIYNSSDHPIIEYPRGNRKVPPLELKSSSAGTKEFLRWN